MLRNIQSRFSFIVPLSGSIALFAMLFTATRYGLGLSPDSTAYVKAADGLLKGYGWAFASVQWPPLYSLVLAIFGFPFGGNVFFGARLLHALLIAINFILIARLLMQYATFRPLVSYVLAFLISLHEVLLWVDFYVWSEPLLITFVLLDLLLIRVLLVKQSSKIDVIELGLIGLAIMAVMTRYIGINVALINMVVVFALTKSSNIWIKLIRSGCQVVVPAILMMLWLSGHQAIDDNSAIVRTLQYPEINTAKFVIGLENFGRWLYPSSSKFPALIPDGLLMATGLALLLAILLSVAPFVRLLLPNSLKEQCLNTRSNRSKILRGCAGVFIIFYLSFLAFIMCCYDKKVFFDNRFLSPIFIPTLLIVLGSIPSLSWKWLKNSLIFLSIIILSCTYFYLRAWLLINYFDGVEINSRSNINKAVYAKTKAYPPTCQVYADEPWNIVLYFDTKVRWLPRQILFGTGFVNSAYESEVQAMKGDAQIVLIEKRDDPLVATLDSSLDFERVYEGVDGLVWVNRTIDQSVCIKK